MRSTFCRTTGIENVLASRVRAMIWCFLLFTCTGLIDWRQVFIEFCSSCEFIAAFPVFIWDHTCMKGKSEPRKAFQLVPLEVGLYETNLQLAALPLQPGRTSSFFPARKACRGLCSKLPCECSLLFATTFRSPAAHLTWKDESWRQSSWRIAPAQTPGPEH